MRIPRLRRRYRQYAWMMTVATVHPVTNGWVLISNSGTIRYVNPGTHLEVRDQTLEYVRDSAAEEHPWLADALLNVMFFDVRPNKLTRRGAGFRLARPAAPAIVESEPAEEALDA